MPKTAGLHKKRVAQAANADHSFSPFFGRWSRRPQSPTAARTAELPSAGDRRPGGLRRGGGLQPVLSAGTSGRCLASTAEPRSASRQAEEAVIDGTPVGQGFKITEASYNTTAGESISVVQVSVAVPEPASMTLMALGAAGVAAWRARRTAKAAAGAESTAETETW